MIHSNYSFHPVYLTNSKKPPPQSGQLHCTNIVPIQEQQRQAFHTYLFKTCCSLSYKLESCPVSSQLGPSGTCTITHYREAPLGSQHRLLMVLQGRESKPCLLSEKDHTTTTGMFYWAVLLTCNTLVKQHKQNFPLEKTMTSFKLINQRVSNITLHPRMSTSSSASTGHLKDKRWKISRSINLKTSGFLPASVFFSAPPAAVKVNKYKKPKKLKTCLFFYFFLNPNHISTFGQPNYIIKCRISTFWHQANILMDIQTLTKEMVVH